MKPLAALTFLIWLTSLSGDRIPLLFDSVSAAEPERLGHQKMNRIDSQIKLRVDWPAFMERHKLIWDMFPGRWENAPFIGNGLTGAMIYASADSAKVKWDLGRSDVGRLAESGVEGRIKGGRIQIGSMNLKTAGKILFEKSYAELDIWNGEATGIIKTTVGELSWRTYSVLDIPAMIIEVFDIKGEEKLSSWVPEFHRAGPGRQVNGISISHLVDTAGSSEVISESGECAIAWAEERSSESRILYLSIGGSSVNKRTWDRSARSRLSAEEEALTSLETARRKGVSALRSESRNWWHAFYRKSFMAIPRLECESYYWIQLYKMASTSREGYPMIDCHGVWSVHPAYNYAVWDYNVEATYRLHLKSNHLELGKPLIDFMDRNFNETTMWNDRHREYRAGIRQQTFLHYVYGDDEPWTRSAAKFPPIPSDGSAKLLWGCHNYWMQYRYSMDSSMLKRLLLILEGGINSMAAELDQGSDGRLHIPIGRSWELWLGKDPSGLIAILDWALSVARTIGTKLNYDIQKLSRWAYLQENLASVPTGRYPNGETGILLGSYGYYQAKFKRELHYKEDTGLIPGNENLPVPYRHWSHLLMIFPLQTLTYEQETNRDLIKNSVDYWSSISVGLDGKRPPACFAPAGAMGLYASIGQADMIDDIINNYLYKVGERKQPLVWPSTMYRENGPVIETPLLFAAALQDLLLQSHNGVIKVFPAVPDAWKNAAIHDFRAEGGFLVSAKFRNGTTEFIKIKSLAGEDFVLETDMQNVRFESSEGSTKIEKVGGNRFQIRLPQGDSLLLFNAKADTDFTIEPLSNQSGKPNSFGLNKTFLEKREFMNTRLFPEK